MTMKDYREALLQRNVLDPYNQTEEWKRANEKIREIVEKLLGKHVVPIAHEVEDEIFTMAELLENSTSEESSKGLKDIIEKDLALLKKYGFERMAAEIEKDLEEE